MEEEAPTQLRKILPAEFILPILLAFFAGVSAANFELSPLDLFILGGVMLLWLWYSGKFKNVVLLLASATFLFGFAYYFLYANAAAQFLRLPENGKPFQALVVEEPSLSGRLLRLIIDLQNPYHGEITALADSEGIEYGDLLEIQGDLLMENGTPIIKYPRIEIIAHHKGNWIREKLFEVKQVVVRGFNHFLPPDHAALLAGVTLGSRSSFSKDLKADMASSGTIHIVAVSGYNISVVALSIAAAAAFFLPRRIALWIAGTAVVLFVSMVGSGSSVMRAAIMGITALFAEGVGRPKEQAELIALAAVLMAAWNPTIISTDISFLLSFLALLGVVYLSPALRSLWRSKKEKGVLGWKENFDTTLGAQLGVLPVLLFVFGKVSLTSLLANILILPLIPLTMGTGFLLGLILNTTTILAFPIAEFARLLTTYEIEIIRLSAHYAIPVGNFFFSPVAVVIYYSLLAWFIIIRQKSVTAT